MSALGAGIRLPGGSAPGFLEALLFAALIWTGWHFIHQPEAPAEDAITIDLSEPGQAPVDLKQLTAIALFGKVKQVEKSPVAKQPVIAPVSVSKLQLKLKGTVLAQDRSAALIAPKPGAEDGVFSVGDFIVPGVRLITVEAGFIVIDDHGKREKVIMEKSKAIFTAARPAMGVPRTSNNPFGNLAAAGHASSNVTTPQATNAQNEFLNMISMAGLTPHSENGKFQGMAVHQTISGGLFSKLGLNKGDIIQSMNGRQIKNTRDASLAYGEAKKAGKINMVIIRDGLPQTIYQLVQ